MGVLTGDFADAKIIHPLDTEDGDDVGPEAYTLKNTAAIQATAKFGQALLCDANGESLDSDVAVPNFDQSDTAKTMYHFWWRTPTLVGQQAQVTWINSVATQFKSRIFWNAAGQRIRIEWIRDTDISPGDPVICVDSASSQFSTDVFSAVSAYINASGTSEGKIFKDGVDITNAVITETFATRGTSGFDFLRIGNNFNGLDPGNFIDHVTVIQSPSLSNAKAASIAFNYHDTQGSGYFPTFGSLSFTAGDPGAAISLFGRGYGIDVLVQINGVDVDSQVRVDQGQVDFLVPNLAPGTYDLSIKNVVANVTLTESAVFIVPEVSKVLAVTSIDKRIFQLEFDRDVKQVSADDVDDALNPSNYVLFFRNQPQFTAIYLPTPIKVTGLTARLVEIELNDDFSYGRDYGVDVRNVEPA